MKFAKLYSEKLSRILLLGLVLLASLSVAQHYHERAVRRPSLHAYCRSFKSCHDCIKSSVQCEWCHDFGCTNHAQLHCPKKAFLDNVWRKDSVDRHCTEIETKSPLFLPANIRQFIKVELRVSDMTLYERNIVCEINIEQKVVQVAGSLDQNTVYCDTVVLKINKNIAIGSLRLIWGGAEPYSNTVLIISYKCQHMAQSCKECQSLNREFRCGWCDDTSTCTMIEECPRQFGPWINRNSTCGRTSRSTSYQRMKNLWYKWD